MSTKTTFKEFIITLKAIENQIKDLQDEADAIKDLIKEELTTEGLEEVIIDDYKIIYRDVISNRFDSTNFKKSHAELYKEFTKTTTYKRLTIN
jgi:predicted phage-related endonuclease